MFENIIAQAAAAQIAFDMERREIPQSILFQGPPLSGKGATALEAARAFSCSAEGAHWGCGCEHCVRHRLLSHPDLVVTGRRPFLPEINAAKEAFFREALPATKMLFIRAVKKLLLRFSTVLAEGDSRLSKINGPIEDVNGDLEEWAAGALKTEKTEKEAESFLKLTDAIIKNAVKLDAEGITDTIPVSHIRAASYWLRTAPAGNKKVFIIENAEKMLDAARNSLLKTLEEPPSDAVIILTSAHPKMLLATILSRVRPYTFVQRSAEREADVLRRVFREKTIPESAGSPLLDYFERCSGISQKSLEASAALWVASVAAAAVVALKKTKGVLPPELVALGKYAVPIAEKADYGRPNTNLKTLLETIMEKMGGFAERETFTRFLEETLSVIRGALFTQEVTPLAVHYTETGRAHIRTAQTAVETYNQGKTLALERLFLSLSDSFSTAA
jgi:DNA polymerase-3 subunit gamma/tau